MPFTWGTIDSYLGIAYLVVFTYEPHDRDRVIEQRLSLEDDREHPKQITFPGWEVLGEWSDLAGGRFYTIIKPKPDPNAVEGDPKRGGWNLSKSLWMRNNLGKVEMIPITETYHLLESLH